MPQRNQSFLFDEPFNSSGDKARNSRSAVRDERFNRKEINDPYARMVASPIRRCILTSAKLPLEFMIKIRLLSVDGPGLDSGSGDGKAGRGGRKTYVVPAGLLVPSSATTARKHETEPTTSTTRIRTDTTALVPSTRPGKSKYVLCNAQTFRRLLNKKDRKALGPDVHVPLTIVSRIEGLLRERIVAEVDALTTKAQQAGTRGWEWQNEAAGTSTRGPILAVLDFSEPTPDESAGGSSMTAKILYPENKQESGGYPVYHVPSLFTPFQTSRIRGSLSGMGSADPMIALYLPRPIQHTTSAQSEAVIQTAQQQTTEPCVPDPIPLAIALWRLRLWLGDGWTGSSPSGDPRDDRADVREQERHRGRVVQGFKTVQGVLHSKWP